MFGDHLMGSLDDVVDHWIDDYNTLYNTVNYVNNVN